MALLGSLPVKLGNFNGAINGHGFAQRLNALDLVHGLGGEVRFAAVRTGPHGDAFNDQKAFPRAKTPRDSAKLNSGLATRGAPLARQRRS